MKYICDPCFTLFPYGTVQDISGTVQPTLALPCDRCSVVVVVSGSGHLVNSYPDVYPLPVVVSGSQ